MASSVFSGVSESPLPTIEFISKCDVLVPVTVSLKTQYAEILGVFQAEFEKYCQDFDRMAEAIEIIASYFDLKDFKKRLREAKVAVVATKASYNALKYTIDKALFRFPQWMVNEFDFIARERLDDDARSYPVLIQNFQKANESYVDACKYEASLRKGYSMIDPEKEKSKAPEASSERTKKADPANNADPAGDDASPSQDPENTEVVIDGQTQDLSANLTESMQNAVPKPVHSLHPSTCQI